MFCFFFFFFCSSSSSTSTDTSTPSSFAVSKEASNGCSLEAAFSFPTSTSSISVWFKPGISVLLTIMVSSEALLPYTSDDKSSFISVVNEGDQLSREDVGESPTLLSS
uniref:Putative secreted protein ovary overexpressed n=1 Tax=Rhipicephalus microplus TaxID=6941 RepID=A0A6M2D9N0_RHIMP